MERSMCCGFMIFPRIRRVSIWNVRSPEIVLLRQFFSRYPTPSSHISESSFRILSYCAMRSYLSNTMMYRNLGSDTTYISQTPHRVLVFRFRFFRSYALFSNVGENFIISLFSWSCHDARTQVQKYADKIHLDVYSSFEFHGDGDKPFEALFEQWKHPGCTYHGFVSNERFETHFVSLMLLRIPRFGRKRVASQRLKRWVLVVRSWPEFGCTSGDTRTVRNEVRVLQYYVQECNGVYQNDGCCDSDVLDSRGDTSKTRDVSYAARSSDGDFQAGQRDERSSDCLLRVWCPNLRRSHSEVISNRKAIRRISVYLWKRELRGEIDKALLLYERALTFSPRNSVLAIALGMMKILVGDSMSSVDISLQGFDLLESVIASDSSFRPLPRRRGGSIVRYGVAVRGAFWYVVFSIRWEQHTHIISQVQSTTFC